MKRTLSTSIAALGAAFCLAGPAAATVTQSNAVATATQDDSGNTVYYGNAGDWMMIKPSPDTQGGDGYVKFDLSGVPDGQVVTSATLYLDWNSGHNWPLKLGIFHGSNDNWSLANLGSPIGYDAAQQMAYITVDGSTPTFNYTGYSLNLSANNLLADLVDNQLTLGLIVDDANTNPGNYTYLHAFAYNGGYRYPYLSIVTEPGQVPAPAAIWLVGAGLIGIGLTGRKSAKTSVR